MVPRHLGHRASLRSGHGHRRARDDLAGRLRAPLHVHEDLDDTWYILDGEMVVRCGDDELVVGAGHWVSMPRGVPHSFRVVGDHEARILLVHDNASFRDLVRDLSAPATARVVPSQPAFPPMDELARIASSHDLRPIGPPMSVEDSASILAAAG